MGANLNYTSTDDVLFNPERGLYVFGPMVDTTNYDYIRSQGYSICYASIILEDYVSSNIAQSKLDEIDRAFGRIRAAGMKAFVRIVYDNTGAGQDATITWMETHLQQLQPVLLSNSDVIAWFQAGMIGAWGEWHSSTNNHHLNPLPVWNLIKQYFPPDKFVAIRTPTFVNTLEGLDANPLTDQDAFNGTGRARIAHHNDCWLANALDYGTYPADPAAMEAQKAQIENQSKYTPWGGETCAVSAYANCTVAVAEAARFHATYMNDNYHPDVIAGMTADGCWQSQFKNKLGYRFELISSQFPDKVFKGKEFSVTINLKNVGWAPLYNERPVFLRMLKGSTIIKEYRLTSNADPRRWLPENGTITISEVLRAPETIDFQYVKFAIWLPDNDTDLRARSDYSVHFANSGVWDSSKGHNILTGLIPVSEFIKGDFNDDKQVNMSDLTALAENWLASCLGPGWCSFCDLNESGLVDYADFSEMAQNWM